MLTESAGKCPETSASAKYFLLFDLRLCCFKDMGLAYNLGGTPIVYTIVYHQFSPQKDVILRVYPFSNKPHFPELI
jgi:hypothetical protein